MNSPSGRTLQSDTWLWDDMPLNSPKCPPYWNSTSGFHFDHITAVDMSFCTSLRNFIPIRPPSAEKMTSCRFSRWRISAILDFRGPIMGSHVRLPIGRQYRHIGLYGLRPPFLAVPDVIAHPSTASVPITVLLYDDPLLCGFNVVIKGLKVICLHCTSYYVMSFVRTFIRCQQCPAAISYLSISDKRVLFRVENTKHITELLSV